MTRLGSSGTKPAVSRQGNTRRARRLPLARLLAAGALTVPAALGAAGCGGPADAATSTDITVMTMAPTGSGATDRAGMTALADAIGRKVNATGGISGRRLHVLVCNEHNTAEGADACAQQAVDAKAIAVVGSYTQWGDTVLPVLEGKGIPWIGGYGLSTDEFRSPDSYPVNGGTPSLLAGNGRQLIASGCRSVAVVRPDTRAGDVMLSYLSRALAPSGIKPVDIPAPEQSTDYTSVAERAIGDDQPHHCVTAALAADPTQTFLDAYRRLHHTHTRLSSVIGSFQQSVVDATGGSSGPLAGAYATSWYPDESSKVWNGLRETARDYAPDSTIDPSDPGIQTTWVAYQVFLQTVERLGAQVDVRSLENALDTQDPVSTGGATPPLSWRLSDMLASVDSPRLVNTSVTFQAVQNGQFVEQQQRFVDVRWVLTNAS
ncbi:ABC transporter substrate-binding protein [Streptacidiphilus griseoplanus]|uniref:ABC transporter substrate-binding protein n=1 Tax=Peterkaempfera griseoplana TaxID=66896 RepID=UPI0007C75DD2|nr:ABC transporter substrate-binding protein [Peterkaempfera griseoplana]